MTHKDDKTPCPAERTLGIMAQRFREWDDQDFGGHSISSSYTLEADYDKLLDRLEEIRELLNDYASPEGV